MNKTPIFRELDESDMATIIPEGVAPPGVFAVIWEVAGLKEYDHRYFVERDGRYFLRILHRVGEDEQAYLLEVFPEASVSTMKT